ncbi:serine hydrolase [Streptomyces sp. SL13]|uniref:Serine hydrolase n=1 Tax=Streptantibioticus silvisoli TaxID=2705255 RepID=A0AA90KHX2_9ACTN|nr:serine hydrolase [Streptantibioticus silvisoli]MDI5972390.1 serine hydrolase [Streptantibioticus silvisoli]
MLDRRAVLAAVPLTAAAAVLGVPAAAGAAVRPAAAPRPARVPLTGRFDQPQQDFAPQHTLLRSAPGAELGLDQGALQAGIDIVNGYTVPDPATGHPLYSGQVTLLAHDGVVVTHEAAGWAVRYADLAGDLLPDNQCIEMRPDTIFDLASLSKLFTSICAMQQIEAGTLDLSATVASYLPSYASNGKGDITIQMLLTHTSGLPADPTPALWTYPDMASKVAAILGTVPQYAAGSTYLYSDLNMLSLQQVLQAITGKTLDTLVEEGITAPLRMRDTMYNPPASLKPRIAAEEYEQGPGEPQRGLVWGQVHDENAWAMDGVAGHAGVFSTVADMAVLSQAVLNGGVYAGHRILSEESVTEMMTNYNQKFPGDSHGLGFELDQRWYSGRLDSPRTSGHTGFTGTTIVIDPLSRSIALQFSNRCHPTRNWGSTNPARRAVADGLANAMAVRVPGGGRSWYAGNPDATTATLDTTLTARGSALQVAWTGFVDTEPGDDLLTLLASTDGGTTWTTVAVTATGDGAPAGQVTALSGGARAWWRVTAAVPAATGPLVLRWQYVTDAEYTGRGVNVAHVTVRDAGGPLLDGDRAPGAFTATGFTLTDR